MGHWRIKEWIKLQEQSDEFQRMFSETFLTLIWRDRMLLLEFVVPAANPDRPAAGVPGRIANCKKFLELKMLRGKKQQKKKEKKKKTVVKKSATIKNKCRKKASCLNSPR